MRPRRFGGGWAPRRPSRDTDSEQGDGMGIAIGILIGLLAGGALVVGWLALTGSSKLAAARRTRQLLVQEARREADALRREAQLEAKEEAARLREEAERELNERQAESVRAQERLAAEQAELER